MLLYMIYGRYVEEDRRYDCLLTRHWGAAESGQK